MTSLSALLDLTGQAALVTGATGGIGRGISRHLASAGAHVIIHSGSSLEKAKDFTSELQAAGYKADPVQADLSKPHEIEALMKRLDAQGLTPNLLVNNAGLQPVTPLVDIDPKAWQSVMATNLEGVFLLCQKFCAALKARPDISNRAIVNIASIEGLDPAEGHAHYSASKAGLIMFTRSAALEYGPDNIRINSISPGLIDRDGLTTDWPDGVASWQENAPLKRLGTSADIAHAVHFLLSQSASWISGSNLVVDGGMSAQPRW